MPQWRHGPHCLRNHPRVTAADSAACGVHRPGDRCPARDRPSASPRRSSIDNATDHNSSSRSSRAAFKGGAFGATDRWSSGVARGVSILVRCTGRFAPVRHVWACSAFGTSPGRTARSARCQSSCSTSSSPTSCWPPQAPGCQPMPLACREDCGALVLRGGASSDVADICGKVPTKELQCLLSGDAPSWSVGQRHGDIGRNSRSGVSKRILQAVHGQRVTRAGGNEGCKACSRCAADGRIRVLR